MKKTLNRICSLLLVGIMLFSLVPGMAAQTTGTTYYVSSRTGSDANDGLSAQKPFYSLHMINNLNLQPGDTVLLERGSVFENQYIHLRSTAGTAEAPIVIDAYGTGAKPLINTNGQGVWYQNYGRALDNANHLSHGWVSSCVLLYDAEYVEIRNIAMTNYGQYGETVAYATDGYDAGTVIGEYGYSSSAAVGSYTWGSKMNRTGVAAVTSDIGTADHIYVQNLDIENIYGNVYDKHMNNGGIYFTVAKAHDSSTGFPKFDDVRIEGNYLKRTSRWGIAVAYSAPALDYRGLANNAKEIPNETIERYGMTNVYVGYNYLEEIGGDPITLMYAYNPLTEYNVSLRGAREICGHYHNSNRGNKGTVAAGIWPWKCKLAIFQYNECFDMMHNDEGNGDGQPWDADYGDTTVYQYNYSSGNTGGTIMFCGDQAYNSVFRYNIAYLDGVLSGANGNTGPLDMAGNPSGLIYNNTFIMKQGIHAYYRSGGYATAANNIFCNYGDTAYAPGWTTLSHVIFDTNLYSGFGNSTGNDAHPLIAEKSAVFADPTFAGAPTAPLTTSKDGVGTVKNPQGVRIRSWSRDWDRDFEMFKLAPNSPAINAAKDVGHSGLIEDSSFGWDYLAPPTDFYGTALDWVRDMGAHDTATATAMTGDYYTAAEPLVLPNKANTVAKAEAEKIAPHNGTADVAADCVSVNSTEAASGGKYVAGLAGQEYLSLPYVASSAGTYTLTVGYRAAAAKALNWRGDNVEDHEATLPAGTGFVEEEFDFVVTQAGPGVVEFYSDAAGAADLDYFAFTLPEVEPEPDPVDPDPSNPDPVDPDPSNPDPVDPDPVDPDPSNPDPVDPDPENPTPAAPKAPVNVTVSNVKAYSATVSWTAGDNTAVSYRVYLGNATTPVAVVTSGTSANLSGLSAETAYTVRVVAVNGAGRESAAATATFTTAKGTSPAPSDPGPSTPSKPSSPAPSTSGPAAPTTETREDGSVATTVQTTDGTTTQTVREPNGWVAAIVTEPDGDVTITVTDGVGQQKVSVTLPAQVDTDDIYFIDVPEGHWAEDSVNEMAARGIFNGTGDHIFSAAGEMTRGMMATVLHRISGSLEMEPAYYVDVADGLYYSLSVDWASDVGVITGIGNDYYAPDRAVTRQELATMLYRYAKLLGLDVAKGKGDISAFADVSSVGSWATDAMEWAVGQGLIKGRDGSMLAPASSASRAEVATILGRFLDLLR